MGNIYSLILSNMQKNGSTRAIRSTTVAKKNEERGGVYFCAIKYYVELLSCVQRCNCIDAEGNDGYLRAPKNPKKNK